MALGKEMLQSFSLNGLEVFHPLHMLNSHNATKIITHLEVDPDFKPFKIENLSSISIHESQSGVRPHARKSWKNNKRYNPKKNADSLPTSRNEYSQKFPSKINSLKDIDSYDKISDKSRRDKNKVYTLGMKIFGRTINRKSRSANLDDNFMVPYPADTTGFTSSYDYNSETEQLRDYIARQIILPKDHLGYYDPDNHYVINYHDVKDRDPQTSVYYETNSYQSPLDPNIYGEAVVLVNEEGYLEDYNRNDDTYISSKHDFHTYTDDQSYSHLTSDGYHNYQPNEYYSEAKVKDHLLTSKEVMNQNYQPIELYSEAEVEDHFLTSKEVMNDLLTSQEIQVEGDPIQEAEMAYAVTQQLIKTALEYPTRNQPTGNQPSRHNKKKGFHHGYRPPQRIGAVGKVSMDSTMFGFLMLGGLILGSIINFLLYSLISG